ncbi:uncharacterized protein BO95DRAFT_438938 [Aspergillus brunneoviolaceus CBS 621.78]|uniref:Uncharacterized protein n=1 Tax=Aspergillus brunneoviolaceus CBS 621.78 TaxID=1450534 RepID=A0ACD1GK73_9EURO|nr:hypothetical protein BO95DRAFT_438938 [Aspergillus brunneoviolaceus CBS 621.78]RAH49725.1 hypothetical protein BO95DRAFT_438938 [Aspergillus brunneoviolaceus CBS 621.78]
MWRGPGSSDRAKSSVGFMLCRCLSAAWKPTNYEIRTTDSGGYGSTGGEFLRLGGRESGAGAGGRGGEIKRGSGG